MKDRYVFPAILHYAEDGITVSFPDLPGCLTCAQDTETALRRAKEAMGLYLYDAECSQEDIPAPTDVAHLCPEPGEIPSLVEVFMPAIRSRVTHRSVKKTLTLPAWLNAQAEEAHLNFSQILQEGLRSHLGV